MLLFAPALGRAANKDFVKISDISAFSFQMNTSSVYQKSWLPNEL